MKNNDLILWKLKHGQIFLDSFLNCGYKVFDGKKCLRTKNIRLFIKLGLLRETPQTIHSNIKHSEIKLMFTAMGISIYDQLVKLINRGIILKDQEGKINWKNFQFA